MSAFHHSFVVVCFQLVERLNCNHAPPSNCALACSCSIYTLKIVNFSMSQTRFAALLRTAMRVLADCFPIFICGQRTITCGALSERLSAQYSRGVIISVAWDLLLQDGRRSVLSNYQRVAIRGVTAYSSRSSIFHECSLFSSTGLPRDFISICHSQLSHYCRSMPRL